MSDDYKNMNKTQLQETCDALGLIYDNKATKEELLSAITVAVEGGLDEDQAEVEVAGHVRKDEDRVTIIIAEQEGEKQPVQIGVNGYMYAIKRGVPVSVPKPVVGILQLATKQVWNKEMTERQSVPRYPFTVSID